MLGISILMSLIGGLIGIYSLWDITTGGVLMLLFISIFLGGMGATGCCELFRISYRENIENLENENLRKLLLIFLDYGIKVCSIILPLILSIMVLGIGIAKDGMNGMAAMMGGQPTSSGATIMILLIWIGINIIFSSVVIALAYNKEELSRAKEELSKANEIIAGLKKKVEEIQKPKFKCDGCGHEERKEFKFCPKCGTLKEEEVPAETPSIESKVETTENTQSEDTKTEN